LITPKRSQKYQNLFLFLITRMTNKMMYRNISKITLLNMLYLSAMIRNQCMGFLQPALKQTVCYEKLRSNRSIGNADNESEEQQAKADELREKIKKMEESIGSSQIDGNDEFQFADPVSSLEGLSLKGKTVLVAGANGRLGSMVCRYLLRNHPQTNVVAAVHYIGENSPTARGYGRLSYEVGAEDGTGNLGAAWSAEDRTASFQYNDAMKDYNLQNIRIVDVELLDPVQCDTIMEGVNSLIWCATDFNGNVPRAVSALNVGLLFRSVVDFDKGRVEIEGFRNILGAFKKNRQNSLWEGSGGLESVLNRENFNSQLKSENDPINVIMVSASPNTFQDYETPFGTFKDIKRQGENLLNNEFPSLSYTILQMGLFSDQFVAENKDIKMEESKDDGNINIEARRKINRRDAAKAVCDALLNEELVGKKMQVWTAGR